MSLILNKAGPLFRCVEDAITHDKEGSPNFNMYLVGFEIDMKALLTTKLVTNKNVLLNMNNNAHAHTFDTTHVIPDGMVKYGVLTVEFRGTAIRIYIGGNQPNTHSSFYDFIFDNFKAVSKVSIQLYVQGNENTAHMNIFIDDLRATYPIKTQFAPLPITKETNFFTHPAVSEFRINVNNPRFSLDFWNNIYSKGQWSTTFPSKLCKSKKNCEKCSYVAGLASLNCERCMKGFAMVNNVCMGESRLK